MISFIDDLVIEVTRRCNMCCAIQYARKHNRRAKAAHSKASAAE